MEQFFSVHRQSDDADTVIDECIDELSSAPGDLNFGFLYATDVLADRFEELYERCREATGIEHWIGSLGIGIISDTQEHYDTPAVSVMLTRFGTDDFAMLPLCSKLKHLDSSIATPRGFDTHFAIVHADPYNTICQDLIETLHSKLTHGFLVGGLTSSQSHQYQLNDGIVSDGISGVILSENIGVQCNLSQGCSPVSTKHSITRSSDNIAIRLDDRPALAVLMEDLGIDDHEQLRDDGIEAFVGLCVPGSDRSDYQIRNFIGVDIERELFAINDELTEGNELMFCHRDQQTAVDDMKHMLENLERRLDGTPRGGLYVSCLGRGREQFGQSSEEIQMIHEVLGDFPLTGFFANGEIHHERLYGFTGVLTLFT